MFSGFRSRWTTPAACAAARPSATCVAISNSLRMGTGFPVSRPRSDSALDKFADNVLLAGLNAEVVHGDDIGMIQRGDGACFTLEAASALHAACIVFAENLDRDVAVQPRIAGAVHLAHASGAERGPDLVGAQSSVRQQRHSSPVHILRALLPGP